MYDEFVMREYGSNPKILFKKLIDRAMEPYILGGEDVENLVAKLFNLIKNYGDRKFYELISTSTDEEQSAIKIFLHGSMHKFGENFPKTKSYIDNIPYSQDWPCIRVENDSAAENQKTN